MSINEALHSICPSFSVKIALGIGLFNNALNAMGSERHLEYYKAAWNREVRSALMDEMIFVLILTVLYSIDYHLFGYNGSVPWLKYKVNSNHCHL